MNPSDEQHLRLLSIFHYVVAAITALCACFPIIYLIFGVVMLSAPSHNGPPRALGVVFVVLPLLLMLVGWALAACIALAGHHLSRRRHYMFCFAMAWVMCLMVIFCPYVTALGVFTIIVLSRASVKQAFSDARRTAA